MGLISRVSSRTYRFNFLNLEKMFIPTEDRLKIYRNLFSEGVMIAKKDTRSIHKGTQVKNLYVLNAMKSLKSKDLVKQIFVWQHFHWTLNEEGVTYLRQALHLPENVMPQTLKRAQEAPTARQSQRPKVSEPRPVYDREQYRRDDKTGDAGVGSDKPQYRGGYGRGRPTQ